MNLSEFENRHPAVRSVLQFFDSAHLPAPLREVAQAFEATAAGVVKMIEVDHPQLTIALQDLLRAKDAAVRAAADMHGIISGQNAPAPDATLPAGTVGTFDGPVTVPSVAVQGGASAPQPAEAAQDAPAAADAPQEPAQPAGDTVPPDVRAWLTASGWTPPGMGTPLQYWPGDQATAPRGAGPGGVADSGPAGAALTPMELGAADAADADVAGVSGAAPMPGADHPVTGPVDAAPMPGADHPITQA